MEFTFNQNKPVPHSFLRIDQYLYKFTVNHTTFYKLDFQACDLENDLISYKNYKAYRLELNGRHNNLKTVDEQTLITIVHIIRDFLQKKVTANVMLLKNEKLLSNDIFELKSRFDLKKLESLFEEGFKFYLVREVS